jgi:hypothetical protein
VNQILTYNIGRSEITALVILHCSFIGSSMAFVIAFILPCGSFIVIEDQVPAADRKNEFIIIARIITIFSVVGAITCTANSLF